MRKSILVAVTLAGGWACGADSITSPGDTAFLAKLVALAAHADAGSYTGLTNLVGASAMETPAFDARSCQYQGASAGFTCAPQTASHYTFRLRVFLFDAQGQAIGQLTANAAASARVELDISGTYASPYLEPVVTLNRHSDATIDGLLTPMVTINGTTSYNDDIGSPPFVSKTTVSGTATNLRLPLADGAYPASGTIVTAYASRSGVSNDVMTINSTVTFNGSRNVPVVIDIADRHLVCIGDLTQPFGTPCQN